MNEAEEDRVLRENLRVHALSPDALARIRRATEAEWRANFGQPARRGWLRYAVAASVAALTLAAAWAYLASGPGTQGGALLAQLARAEAPGVVEQRPLWRDLPLAVGSEIRAGQSFEVGGGTLLTLSGGGNLRVAAGSAFAVLAANAVRLERGTLYVDIPPGSRTSESFMVITSAGEFRHVGTQFALVVMDGGTRLRVREGSVHWRAADGESTVDAGTELFIDRDHNVTRNAIGSTGEYWAWTETMSPDIDIEDRPLAEFLDWVARETGRKLEIADDATRQQIAKIRIHGNVRGMQPMQALKVVMASTSLRFELPDDAIRVSFAGGSPPSIH